MTDMNHEIGTERLPDGVCHEANNSNVFVHYHMSFISVTPQAPNISQT